MGRIQAASPVIARVPKRHWRSYGATTRCRAASRPGTNSFAAFPSWFLRIQCDRCGKVQMVNEAHFARPNMPIRAILAKIAPRRLRRAGREGGAAHRHRGRQQPAGAADRAAGGVSAAQGDAGNRTAQRGVRIEPTLPGRGIEATRGTRCQHHRDVRSGLAARRTRSFQLTVRRDPEIAPVVAIDRRLSACLFPGRHGVHSGRPQSGFEAKTASRLIVMDKHEHPLQIPGHSPENLCSPEPCRSRATKYRKPITDLMMPNTGSGICLRNA